MLIASLTFGILIGNVVPSNVHKNVNQSPNIQSAWSISSAQALLWNGQTSTFYGLNTDGSRSELKSEYGLGCRTFCLNLPVTSSRWKTAIPWLQTHHCTYFVRISSLAPQTNGYPIDPIGYRVPNITENTKLNIEMPGATQVLTISAVMRDGTVEKTKLVPTPNGKFQFEVKPMNDLPHVLLMYPLTQTLQIPDFWNGADEQRDQLLSSLSSIKDKSGLRGIIDPLGAMVRVPKPNSHFVPHSKTFREEFAAFLRGKYHMINALYHAWGILAPDQSSFRDMARLVPLWVGAKGVRDLYDSKTNHVYMVGQDHTSVWQDIQTVINASASRRFDRLTSAIHSVVDVPVFQSWKGWGVPYEHGSEVDGIAFATQGSSPIGLLHYAVRAESSALRSGKSMLTLADNYHPKPLSNDSLQSSLEDLQSLNVTGVFLNSRDPKAQSQFLQVTKNLSPNSFLPIQALYFPEAATNPAEPQLLAGGMWWLPSPIDGNRLELGSNLKGYEMNQNGQTSYVVWSGIGAIKEFFDSKTAGKVTVSSSSPDDLRLKNSKDGFSMILPSLPVKINGLTSPPSPVTLYDQTISEFQLLMAYRKSLHQSAIETEINFNNAKDGYPRNPGTSMLAMRKALRELAMQFGSFTWVPCAHPRSSVIGAEISDPSSIDSKVWEIRSDLQIPGSINSVAYRVMPKSAVVSTLWIAAKIDPSEISKVHVRIGGQVMGLVGPPQGNYGIGYGWYKVGTVELNSQTDIEIEVDGSQPYSIRLDALVLTPMQFNPNGTALPETPEELAKAVPPGFKLKKKKSKYLPMH